jgi:hypothetical protein
LEVTIVAKAFLENDLTRLRLEQVSAVFDDEGYAVAGHVAE